MASNASRREGQRPRPLHTSKSFSRHDPPSPITTTRSQRAFTLPAGSIAPPVVTEQDEADNGTDSRANESEDGEDAENDTRGKASEDELPIELASLADSFVDSLNARVHALPPSIERLTGLFQNFYITAATHINTHISTLSSRQHRNTSPTPSISSRGSTASLLRAKAASLGAKEQPRPLERRDTDQQMLTSEEIATRKRARKDLEHKRLALEEALEKRVCEKIYDKIWRHRTTQDEASDEKLRSKTAALSVVGIGLSDLGVDLGEVAEGSTPEEREAEVRQWLDDAREEIARMDDEKYPLGKLQHLKAAHKGIVETLSHFHPSSSADEIMPMLIYTLITSDPEKLNVISNLWFIQRFRNEAKIDGEAAYCLTNLEAAISFLETVDLSTLRENEPRSGPPKTNSQPSTPRGEPPELVIGAGSRKSSFAAPSQSGGGSLKPGPEQAPNLRPRTGSSNRRISGIFQPPAQAFGAASDAVLNTADQGFKNLSNSLGDSYKFLIGKLSERERQISASGNSSDVVVPRTLDDARKLVGTTSTEDDGSVSGESVMTEADRPTIKAEDRLASLIGGKKLPSRDRSVDSNLSSSSSKKAVAFANSGGNNIAKDGSEKGGTASPSGLPASQSNPALVESMRNLGNSLNPMNRIAGIGGIAGGMNIMRGFGRNTPTPTAGTPTPTPTASTSAPPLKDADGKVIPDRGVADLTTAFPELASALPPKEQIKVAPPIKRFMELQNPGDLRLNEVLELLRDYRRLANALKDLGAI